MFTTTLESFDYKPLVINGETQRGFVVLEADVEWLGDDEQTYTVPKGFVFDLASVPWFVGWIIIKLGKHLRAACLHDWFYRNKTNTKAWADLQFRLAMEIDGVKGWRKWSAWSGVAVGGWGAWKSDDHIDIIKGD